jgi:hypothetical protein
MHDVSAHRQPLTTCSNMVPCPDTKRIPYRGCAALVIFCEAQLKKHACYHIMFDDIEPQLRKCFSFLLPDSHLHLNVRASDETQRRGTLFLSSVTWNSVSIGLLTIPLLLPWNLKVEDAFISTPCVHLQWLMQPFSCPFAYRIHATYL